MQDNEPIPCLQGWRLIRGLPHLLRDPLSYWIHQTDTYGDVLQFKMVGHTMFLFNTPETIRHVLVEHPKNYHRRGAMLQLRAFLGQGLFLGEEAIWKRQRKLMQPAYRKAHVAESCDVVLTETARLLADWHARPDPVVDVEREMKTLMLRTMTRSLFLGDLDLEVPRILDALDVILTYAEMKNNLIRDISRPITKKLGRPLIGEARMEREVAYLDSVVYPIIEQARKNRQEASLLLQILIEAEEAGDITTKQIRDEMMNLLFAGFDTVAETLTWTFFQIAQHPEVAQQLSAEIKEKLSDTPQGFADFQPLTYTRQVIDETLRMYPPAWVIFRVAYDEDRVAGVRVPAGSYVMMSPFVFHRNGRIWPQPHQFDPARFTDRAMHEKAFHYIPFGAGRHLCVGKPIALLQLQMIVPLIWRAFRMRLVSTPRPKIRPGIIIHADKPIRLHITPR